MKFIGHLDIMRYFQKAVKRAGLDAAYSEGFSPHMIMSFAAPLGVGITSEGEYFDLELKTPVSSKEAVEGLNQVMVEGMEVLSVREVPEGKKGKAMSLVSAADYLVSFRKGMEPGENWQEKIRTFMEQPEILILKKRKKNEKEDCDCSFPRHGYEHGAHRLRWEHCLFRQPGILRQPGRQLRCYQ